MLFFLCHFFFSAFSLSHFAFSGFSITFLGFAMSSRHPSSFSLWFLLHCRVNPMLFCHLSTTFFMSHSLPCSPHLHVFHQKKKNTMQITLFEKGSRKIHSHVFLTLHWANKVTSFLPFFTTFLFNPLFVKVFRQLSFALFSFWVQWRVLLRISIKTLNVSFIGSFSFHVLSS